MSKIFLYILVMVLVAKTGIAQTYQGYRDIKMNNEVAEENNNFDTNGNPEAENVKQIITASTAIIKILDKQMGRVKEVEIPIGESYSFDKLKVEVKSCYTAPEYETPEASAFIIAYYKDSKFENEENVNGANIVFSGWMFASSPSLSSMEHPIYDIWVIDCK